MPQELRSTQPLSLSFFNQLQKQMSESKCFVLGEFNWVVEFVRRLYTNSSTVINPNYDVAARDLMNSGFATHGDGSSCNGK